MPSRWVVAKKNDIKVRFPIVGKHLAKGAANNLQLKSFDRSDVFMHSRFLSNEIIGRRGPFSLVALSHEVHRVRVFR